MRQIHVEREDDRLEFARLAAEAFAKDSGMRSYTNGPLTQGSWLALRWGGDNDCVVVVKLDEIEEIVNYVHLIPRGSA